MSPDMMYLLVVMLPHGEIMTSLIPYRNELRQSDRI